MPAEAPIRRLSPWAFDPIEAGRDLDALEILLTPKTPLSERDNILPTFRDHGHLCALLGLYSQRANIIDHLAVEAPLFGQFRADVVAGDREVGAYTFVEFEDASENSLFEGDRGQREWSRRCEHAMSQLVDWLWITSDLTQTRLLQGVFGPDPIEATVVLVLGRDHYLDGAERQRLLWRRRFTTINAQHLYICTFDELLRDLRRKLVWRSSIASSKP